MEEETASEQIPSFSSSSPASHVHFTLSPHLHKHSTFYHRFIFSLFSNKHFAAYRHHQRCNWYSIAPVQGMLQIRNGIDHGGGEPLKGDHGDWRLGLRTFDFWWREASLAVMEVE
ncbi:pyruvate dehydrogenase kinase 4 [Sesbania bispinosa]|nr:pyruvate dehydrogenase kinase 4 [Sesbania bispinosa]